MIHINRSSINEPKILTNKASDEHLEAATYYNSQAYLTNPRKPAFKHKLYNKPSVKNAILKLFKERCAYCESYIGHIQDGDIEHFRPKGRVKEGATIIKPGYYWLAADWNNLLLSCTHCNQSRKQKSQLGIKMTIGKYDQFPLKTGEIRQSSPTDPTDENSRLLINPLIENPEDFFHYDKNGYILIQPGLNPEQIEMAETSTKVFALIRINLAKRRKAHFLRVERLISNVENRLRDYLKYSTKEAQNELISALTELNQLADPKNELNEYLAITRQLMTQKKNELDIAFQTGGLI
jgi:uncharacterized protein (TIGR02646 family)